MTNRVIFPLIAHIVIALWIATPAIAAIHLNIEQHNYCQEHEQFEEGSAHGDSAHSHETHSTFHRSDASPHHKCGLAEDLTRQEANPQYIPSWQTLSVVAFAPKDLPYENVVNSDELIRVAPKTSPPSVHR